MLPKKLKRRLDAVFAHKGSFQYTKDYVLLRRCLGNLTPTVAQIEQFCRCNLGWDWSNFPIDSWMFHKHPRIKYSASREVFYKLQQLVLDSDYNSIEHSFLLSGSEYATSSQSALGCYPQLYYTEIHSNRGQATYNTFSPENEYLRDNYNAKVGQLMMLGHTHSNYGNTWTCFSICNLLYGITNISWLRHQIPHPSYIIK